MRKGERRREGLQDFIVDFHEAGQIQPPQARELARFISSHSKKFPPKREESKRAQQTRRERRRSATGSTPGRIDRSASENKKAGERMGRQGEGKGRLGSRVVRRREKDKHGDSIHQFGEETKLSSQRLFGLKEEGFLEPSTPGELASPQRPDCLSCGTFLFVIRFVGVRDQHIFDRAFVAQHLT